MLGKRPCLLRTTSSQSLLIPCEDTEGEPATFCNCAQVTEKNSRPRPALTAPCKIVLGFDIGAEKKPPLDACESPRSVLETSALLPSREKQHVVARSPCSGLGSLLTAKSGSGVGLEIVALIEGKEKGVHVDSVAGSSRAALHLQNCFNETSTDKTSFLVKSSHCHSKDTGWLGNASNSDFMDADISSWQKRQAPCVFCVEDDHLDEDISPRQSAAMFVPSIQDMNANVTDMYISPYQSRVLDAFLGNSLKDGCLDADIFPQRSQAPRPTGLSHATTKEEHGRAQVYAWKSGAPYSPGTVGAVDGCINDHTPTCQTEVSSPCEDKCSDTRGILCQSPALHQVNLDMEECEEVSIQRSIFSAASPPSCYHKASIGFLKVCDFCGQSLRLGKDIFMYRGDQAFCSAECRYQKIVLDERKETQGS